MTSATVAPPEAEVAGTTQRNPRANAWAPLVLPGLLLLGLAYFYPVISILSKSFTDPARAGQGLFADYHWVFSTPVNVEVLFRTIINALEVSVLCLLLGYPFAYLLTIVGRQMRVVLISAVLIPFWTSATVRNYAWLVLLQDHGAINQGLHAIGLPGQSILGTQGAILLGETYVMLPFMILPTYAVMEGINRKLLDAAGSLGAPPRVAFRTIYAPLTVAGATAGLVIVFIQSLGFYLTPAILGRVGSSAMLPQLIVTQVNTLLDWGRGGALSLVLLGTILLILGLSALLGGKGNPFASTGGGGHLLSVSGGQGAADGRRRWGLKTFGWFVAAFMVLPMLIILPMSLTSVESFVFPPPGWSFRWYENFVTDPRWLDSIKNSLIISLAAALLATVLGTAAALALARGRVPGRTVVTGVLLAPMVIPTVITAVAVYLVALNLNLVSTYTSFILVYACLGIPFVLITVSARLQSYDPKLDWAGASLGANKWLVFWHVTVPLILPALLGGALFAFVTALDETVIALFLVGPKLRTVPSNIYEGVLQTIDPTVAAASAVMLFLTTGVILVGGLVSARRRPRAR